MLNQEYGDRSIDSKGAKKKGFDGNIFYGGLGEYCRVLGGRNRHKEFSDTGCMGVQVINLDRCVITLVTGSR